MGSQRQFGTQCPNQLSPVGFLVERGMVESGVVETDLQKDSNGATAVYGEIFIIWGFFLFSHWGKSPLSNFLSFLLVKLLSKRNIQMWKFMWLSKEKNAEVCTDLKQSTWALNDPKMNK